MVLQALRGRISTVNIVWTSVSTIAWLKESSLFSWICEIMSLIHSNSLFISGRNILESLISGRVFPQKESTGPRLCSLCEASLLVLYKNKQGSFPFYLGDRVSTSSLLYLSIGIQLEYKTGARLVERKKGQADCSRPGFSLLHWEMEANGFLDVVELRKSKIFRYSSQRNWLKERKGILNHVSSPSLLVVGWSRAMPGSGQEKSSRRLGFGLP